MDRYVKVSHSSILLFVEMNSIIVLYIFTILLLLLIFIIAL